MRIAIVGSEGRISGLVSYKAKKALEKYRKNDELESFSYSSRRACLTRYRVDGPFDEMFAVHKVNTLADIGTDELIIGIRDIESRRISGKTCHIHRVYPNGVSTDAEHSYYRSAGGKAFNGDPSVMAVELGKYFENLLG